MTCVTLIPLLATHSSAQEAVTAGIPVPVVGQIMVSAENPARESKEAVLVGKAIESALAKHKLRGQTGKPINIRCLVEWGRIGGPAPGLHDIQITYWSSHEKFGGTILKFRHDFEEFGQGFVPTLEQLAEKAAEQFVQEWLKYKASSTSSTVEPTIQTRIIP